MRRRLDLAASLITRPPLIFLDEPTTGLDPRTRGQMWDTIRGLVAEGCTVLLTTQYLDEADQLADRIAVIDRGRKVARGHAGRAEGLGRQLDAAAAARRRRRPGARLRRRPPRPRQRAGADARVRPHQRAAHRRRPGGGRADRPARGRRGDRLGERRQADARRGLPRAHRPRRRRRTTSPIPPNTTSPPWRWPDEHRNRHRRTPARRGRRAHASAHEPRRDGRPDPLDGLARAEEHAPQPGAVLRRDAPAAAVHGDVRLRLRRRDLRRRRELPAADDPRHRRPDRPDHLHGHGRAAARGHGEGRLRPLQVAADRADRAAGRPDGRRPRPLPDRGEPDLRHGHGHRLPPAGRGARRAGGDRAGDLHRLGHRVDLHLGRHDRPQRPQRPGDLDDDPVPADVPVERVRPRGHAAARRCRRS